MKDYYKILGVKKDASEEEVREHWIALMRRFHPDRQKREEVKDERVKEINEAYEVLKHSSTRVKYDLRRAHVRRKRVSRLRQLSLGIGIFVILILGIVFLNRPRVPLQPGPMIRDEREPKKQMSGDSVAPPPPYSRTETSVKVKQGVPRGIPQGSEEVISNDMRKVEEPEPAPPEIFSPSKFGRTAETEKIIPAETDQKAVQESPRVVSQEMRERERSKATVLEQPRVSASVIPRADEINAKDLTVAKRSIAEAPAQGILPDLPTEVKAQTTSPPPSSAPKEEEVRQFFFDYIDRYNQMDLSGFLSLFSAHALQNQKDEFDGIKKTYAKFFGESQELRCRLEDAKIEIHQNSAEVKARYEVDQRLKKGGQKKVWRGHIRWILAREEGVFKIISLDYQHQRSP